VNRGPPCATRRARCDAVASTRPTEHVGLWGALARAASSIRGAVARRTSHARGTTMQHLRTGPFASSSAIAARRDWRSSQGDHGASARQTPRRFSRRAHPGAPLPCFRWTAEVPLLSGHRGYTCHLRLYSHLPGALARGGYNLHETEFENEISKQWFGASFRRQRKTRRLSVDHRERFDSRYIRCSRKCPSACPGVHIYTSHHGIRRAAPTSTAAGPRGRRGGRWQHAAPPQVGRRDSHKATRLGGWNAPRLRRRLAARASPARSGRAQAAISTASSAAGPLDASR
jgi:hypothetical protein